MSIPLFAHQPTPGEAFTAYRRRTLAAAGDQQAGKVIDAYPDYAPEFLHTPEKLEELAQKITHEQLVHYMAFILFSHPDTRWEYTATLDPANLKVVVNRTLFFPPVTPRSISTISPSNYTVMILSSAPKPPQNFSRCAANYLNPSPLPS